MLAITISLAEAVRNFIAMRNPVHTSPWCRDDLKRDEWSTIGVETECSLCILNRALGKWPPCW